MLDHLNTYDSQTTRGWVKYLPISSQVPYQQDANNYVQL